jgi:hypothetical protein
MEKIDYFNDKSFISNEYINCTKTYVLNCYLYIETSFLLNILKENEYRLSRTMKFLKENVKFSTDGISVEEKTTKILEERNVIPLPKKLDEKFIEERNFIESYLKEKEDNKLKKIRKLLEIRRRKKYCLPIEVCELCGEEYLPEETISLFINFILNIIYIIYQQI